MPVSEIDIWRSANELIKLHGEKAWDEAVVRYFELRKADDHAGMDVWRRIANAISWLTDPRPKPPREASAGAEGVN